MDHIAYLSSQNDYIIFNYKGKTVRFTEDYIDLVPILERLYINAPEFLKPIKKVEVRYAS